MAGPIKVFVSATSRDLRTVRAKVAARLRELGHDTVEQPDFETDHRTICAMLLDKITPCHAVVHIAGFVYGAEPRQRPADALPRSYTQLEYEMGVELKKPVFVFLAAESFPFDPHTPDPADLCQRQVEHRTRLESGDRIWYAVATEAELLGCVDKIDFLNRTEPRPRKPNNLPYESLGHLFKGRDDFVTRLRETLVARPAHAAVVAAKQAIHGLGGVGKTRLAIEYGWRFQDQYCALLFVSADSPEGLRRGLAALCRAEILNLPERDAREEAEQVAAAVRWLAGHPGWFLVLDNADTPEAATAVEQLLPRLDGGHVIITSRIAEWGTSGAVAMELDVLDTRPAADFLLARTAGKRRTTPTDDADALALATDLDGLALALEQAGAFIAKHHCSLADYRTRWAAQEKKVLEWFDPRAMKYPKSVAVTWQTSIDQLTDDGRALLNVLAWLAPAPIPVDMILKKPGDDEPVVVVVDAEAGLADLGSFSLVKWEADGQLVVIHRFVQEVTRYRIPEADRRRWIGGALQILERFPTGYPGDVRTRGVWEATRPHIEAIIAFADRFGSMELTTQLMNGLSIYLLERNAHADAKPLLEMALAIDETRYGPHHIKVARDLNNLAALLKETNQFKHAESLMRQSIFILTKLLGNNHPDVAILLSNLSELLHDMNRLNESEQPIRQALAIDVEYYGNKHKNVAIPLNNLAMLLRDMNRLEEAEEIIRRALAINEECYGPGHPAVADNLNNLAQLLHDTNCLNEAESLLRRALLITEAGYGPQHPNVARVLNNLGELLRDKSQLREAEVLLRRALEINEANDGPQHPRVAVSLNNLALVFRETNRLEEADQLYRRGLQLLQHFQTNTGYQHPNWDAALRNYVGFLQARGLSEPGIEANIRVLLDQPPDS